MIINKYISNLFIHAYLRAYTGTECLDFHKPYGSFYRVNIC